MQKLPGAILFTVSFALILAVILRIATTAPPATMFSNPAFAHYRGKQIDYFALGDSVASGYGLDGATGECLRSSKAYPYTVREALEMRYHKVNFPPHNYLACSGAEVGDLQGQVDYVLKHLSADHPTLVSITIGANDFQFDDEKKMKKLLLPEGTGVIGGGTSEADFKKWADATATEVEKQLQPAVSRLILEPNVVVVITDYYNPMNQKATKFVALGIGPASKELCGTCRPRFGYAITQLNGAFLDLSDALGNPAHLALTGDPQPKDAVPIRESFVDHEAPHQYLRHTCGKASPGLDGTWIQPYPDCIHPNEEGAAQIGDAVNLEAYKAGR
jgi:lysophospholipase L1-like esterase